MGQGRPQKREGTIKDSRKKTDERHTKGALLREVVQRKAVTVPSGCHEPKWSSDSPN